MSHLRKFWEPCIREAWVGAVVGGLASAYGAKESNKGSKNAGKVDVYHQGTMYPGTEAYRNAAANRAYELTFGKPAPLSSLTNPDDPRLQNVNKPRGGPGPGPGGGGAKGDPGEGDLGQFTPIATPSTAGGGKKKGKKGKGGGGAADKQPGTTKTAINEAMPVAGEMEKNPTVTAAQDYAAGTLRGEDQNPYREETAGMLRDLNETEAGSNYQRLLDELWGSETGLGDSAPRSESNGGKVAYRGKAISWAGNAPGGGGAGIAGGGGVADPNDPGGRGMVGIEQNLESLLAGNDSPAMQAMREKIKRQGDEALAEQQKALRLRAAGSGAYGGSGQDYAEGTAMGRYGGYLADANAQMYSDLYGQALGLGTQYDISAQDRAAQERMNDVNASASGASTGAALEAAAADRASREKMQRLSLLGDLTGMGLDTEKFRASGMGSLGEGFSGDQRNALSLAGDTNGLGQAGWLNAGGLSLGLDQTNNSLRASLANTGVARQSLEFDKYRYGREAPMRDLAQYSGLISGLYDPYAGSHDFGFDARSQSPSYSNVAGQGLAGAAAGYQLGKDMGF
jgi:hypothetical protein